MKKVLAAVLSLAAVSSSAHADFSLLNAIKRPFAWAAGPYHLERARRYDPIIRPRRVPLMNVQPCDGDDTCVIVNGQKKVLKATPADLMHGRVQVVGTSKEAGFTGVFARFRFGSWVSAEPDYLLVWAAIRDRTNRIKILGYSVQRDDEPGVESDDLKRVTNVAFYKFLTSHNPLETEIARELTERSVFCLKYPADPAETLRDETARLHARNLATDERSEQRLAELNAVAMMVNPEHGGRKCESPITDQMDLELDQVREALVEFLPAPPGHRYAARTDAGPGPRAFAQPRSGARAGAAQGRTQPGARPRSGDAAEPERTDAEAHAGPAAGPGRPGPAAAGRSRARFVGGSADADELIRPSELKTQAVRRGEGLGVFCWTTGFGAGWPLLDRAVGVNQGADDWNRARLASKSASLVNIRRIVRVAADE